MQKVALAALLAVISLSVVVISGNINVFESKTFQSIHLSSPSSANLYIKQQFVSPSDSVDSIGLLLYGTSGGTVRMDIYDASGNRIFTNYGKGILQSWVDYYTISTVSRGVRAPLYDGETYTVQWTISGGSGITVYYSSGAPVGYYAVGQNDWVSVGGVLDIKIAHDTPPPQTYNATVTVLHPSYGETIPSPPVVQFYVESDSPRPRYGIVCDVYYNGQYEKRYSLPSRYPCPDDPNSVLSGDGYVVTRELTGISENRYVEWWVRILHDNTLIYTNENNPGVFLTGTAPPPSPPDTVNVYYYLEDYFPSNYDTSNLPRSNDWHGPVGYWYVNRDNNHIIYQHPEKVDGHTYLIDLDADFTYSGSAFYMDKTLQVTEIPYEVVRGSIDMLYETYSNVPPVAFFTYSPENPSVGEQIVFDASSSYDTDGSITGYEWDFGDGSYIYTSLPTATHTYSSTGSFTVTLTVVDNVFGRGSTSKVMNPVGPCTLTVDVVGSGHVEISPSLQEFPYGTVVTLTAVPSAGSVFDHWSGDIIGIQNPATIVMECDRTVTAHFSDLPHNEYTITVQATPPDGGYVTCTPSAGSHPSGTVITLSAHAKNGYQFDHWSGDISGTSEMTTVVMDGNKNITAHFEKTVSAGNIFGVIAASLSAIVACAVVVTRWKR